MIVYDAHAHLHSREETELRQLLGIRTMISAGTPEQAQEAFEVAAHFPVHTVTAGLHPWYTAQFSPEDMRIYMEKTPLIGENGLRSKLFLLSYHEVRNIGTKSQPNDGAILDYFRGASDPKRIAYRNGAAVYWTLRTPHNPAYLTGNVSYAEAYCVSTPTGGDGHGLMTSVSPCVRPAMIMPMNTMVDGQNNIIT